MRNSNLSIAALVFLANFSSTAGTLEQSKRLHDRLAGVPASQAVLEQMNDLIQQDQVVEAAEIAMQNPAFYNVTLKQFITPWTNEEFDVFAPLNDYTATVIRKCGVWSYIPTQRAKYVKKAIND